MQSRSLSTVDTIFSADAIEFCPTNPRLFACGTYQIEKDESGVKQVAAEGEGAGEGEEDEEEDEQPASVPVVTRYGRCLLYGIDEEGGNL